MIMKGKVEKILILLISFKKSTKKGGKASIPVPFKGERGQKSRLGKLKMLLTY